MNEGTVGFAPESVLYRPPAHFFRGSLGRFTTGVAVVTYAYADESGERQRHGITINSFTSVSIDPPLVLISLQHSVRSHDLLKGRAFAVNVLGAEQQDIALQFAGKPRLEPTWIEGPQAPRLAGALSWFECRPWAEYPGGDHTLFLGEVVDFGYRAGAALGFVNGRFTTVHDEHTGHESLL